jgi:hypothetical protein
MDLKTKHDNIRSYLKDLIATMDTRIKHYEDPKTDPKPCSTHYLSFWLGEKYTKE